MLAIRLTRTGKIHAPHYRIVVQEKRSKLNGKTIDIIGHYHPAQSTKGLTIDKEKAATWLQRGAQPSDTVTNLLVKEGVLKAEQKVHNFFTPTKKVEEKAEIKTEAKAEAKAEVVEETSAEEVETEAPETKEVTKDKE